MKVLSIVFNPFINDSRILKEGITLTRAGYSVKVAALHSEGLAINDNVQGIQVIRLKIFSRKWKGKIAKIIKYAEVTAKLLPMLHRTDIVHCNDLDPLPVCVIAKALSGGRLRVVYDAHEFETEQTASPNKVLHWLMVRIEHFCIKFVDAAITVSDGIADQYANRYGIDKPAVVYNTPFAPEIAKTDIFRRKFGLADDTKIVLYQGGLAEARGLEIMLAAFRKIADRKFALIVMGSGPLKEEIITIAEQSDNIFFHEAVSPDELLNYTASAEAGLLLYPNTCLNNYYCLPNKFFEYIMAGLPVIANDLYEVGRLIRQFDCGIILKSAGPEEIIAAVNRLFGPDYPRYRENTLKMVPHFQWEDQERTLLDIYRNLQLRDRLAK